MVSLGELFSRIRGFLSGWRGEAELETELEAHLRLLADENVRRGMTKQAALEAARREFGGLEQTKEAYRRQRSVPVLEEFLRDVRLASRGLVKNPRFTLVAVVTLALGIGATAAVFSAVDRILFRSLPYPNDDRLVVFGLLAPIEPREFMLGADYLEWRSTQTPFVGVTSMRPGVAGCDLTEQNPIRLSCASVEATFLPVLGIQPLLGRNFTPAEDRPKQPRVALITYALWRSRFGSDPGVVNRTFSLDGQETRIVGVLPATFEMPTLAAADVLLPSALDESAQQRPNTGAVLRAFARLKPGVSARQATSALQPLFEKSLQYVPPMFRNEVHVSVRSLRDRQMQESRLASWILLGAVFAVLLLGCTNIANLLLARATVRAREVAVRVALGATRFRLVCQALTESLVLGVLGGGLGCAVAYALLRLFVAIAPDGIPHLKQASVDVRMLLFVLVISLLAGVFFGIAPALRRPSGEALTGKTAAGGTRGFLRQTLAGAQVAMSIVLLTGAGLLLRTLDRLESVHLGIETENVLIAKLTLGESGYREPAKQLVFFSDLETRLMAIPGVTWLGLSDTLPPSGGMRATIYSNIEVPGRARLAEGTGGMVGWRSVTPGYFAALSIPIVRGRAFQEEDLSPTATPIILSESLARQLFPGEDALGKSLRPRVESPWRTVVGVAADVKNNGLTEGADPEYYVPWKKDPEGDFRTGYFILRGPVDGQTLANWVRTAVAAADATLPVEVSTLRQRVSKLEDRPRFSASLLSLFATIGVFLAAIGIYGVVGFLVAQRTREIGIRMAVGASPAGVLQMVLFGTARWILAGVLAGLLASWFAARLMQSLLFEVRERDPFPLMLAVAVLLPVALAAAWIPARRAMRVDPLVALRYE